MQPNADSFDSITKGLPTKSEKIRALGRAGAATADIARYLGIRYQFARNVLIGSGLHNRREDREPVKQAARDLLAPSVASAWVRMDTQGRLQIPAAVASMAGISADEPVHVRASKDGIEVLSRRAALKRVQEIARQFVPDGASLVDDLIAERRREAELENG